MSFFRKLFPFLFKSEEPATTTTTGPSKPKSKPSTTTTPSEETEPAVIVAFGIIAKVKNARGLRKDSKVYVRSILEDGNRLRVRGLAPNGKKVTITVPRRSLFQFASEGVPEHVAKHYDKHSLFQDEHEARVKAEALGKH